MHRRARIWSLSKSSSSTVRRLLSATTRARHHGRITIIQDCWKRQVRQCCFFICLLSSANRTYHCYALNFKSNFSLYSLYYCEVCNEFAGPISVSLCLQATQLLSNNCRSGGEPLATLCSIWSAWDLNLRPTDLETYVLSLGQLVGEGMQMLRFLNEAFVEQNFCLVAQSSEKHVISRRRRYAGVNRKVEVVELIRAATPRFNVNKTNQDSTQRMWVKFNFFKIRGNTLKMIGHAPLLKHFHALEKHFFFKTGCFQKPITFFTHFWVTAYALTLPLNTSVHA